MQFSQPVPDVDHQDAAPGPEAAAINNTLISLAATLALKDGNADQIRGMLGANPATIEAFNLAMAIQEVKNGAEAVEADRRLSARTADEVEKRRAARAAADAMRADEEAALYAAADADGDTFTLLEPTELDSLPEAETLVEGFLVKESIVRLYGPPKSYKSFVMLDLAACVGAGIPWCGNRQTTKAKVLYVVAEGVRGIRRRVRAWEALNKRPMTGVHFYERAVQMGDRNDVSTLIRTAKRGGFEFIILDTQARCTVGLEENSASEMGVVVAALDVLKSVTGACVALVHHSGAAGGRARGSTAVLGALDAEFEVEADKDTMTVSMHTRAQKDLAEANSVEFDLATAGPGMSLAVKPRARWYRPTADDLPPLGEMQKSVLQVVAAFDGAGANETLVMSRMADGIDKATVREALGQLLRRGCIKRQGATWFVEKHGRMHLEAARGGGNSEAGHSGESLTVAEQGSQ